MHDRKKTQKLLERIVRALIEYPEDAVVTFETVPGLTQWYIKVRGEDQGKARGREAAHIIAIQYLIGEIGVTHEEKQRVTLLESERCVVGHRSPLTQAATYHPGDAHELLHDILSTILTSKFRIDVRTIQDTPPLAYDFHITTQIDDDQAALLEPYDDDPSHNTLIGALGTLWRAYASREGVSFTISTKSR